MRGAPWLAGSMKLGRIWLKVERATRHLDELEGRIAPIEAAPFEIVEARDAMNGDRIWVIETKAAAEHLKDVSTYGVVVADFVHNLRSALDQTIYKLAAAPTIANAFPVCASASGDRYSFFGTIRDEGVGLRRLRTVPNPAFDYVEAIQPYNRLGARDPLWQLNEMWNEDKHRTVLVTANPTWNQQFMIATRDGRDMYIGERKDVDPENPAEVLRLDADSDSEVTLAVPGKVDIRFASPAAVANRPVTATLDWILRYVAGAVLPNLESLV